MQKHSSVSNGDLNVRTFLTNPCKIELTSTAVAREVSFRVNLICSRPMSTYLKVSWPKTLSLLYKEIYMRVFFSFSN